jgi:uncharacterized membrane-anchored protein YhcB (DUF1043 family)
MPSVERRKRLRRPAGRKRIASDASKKSEERIRVEETERRHRVDAEMKLQHERMRLEVEAKAATQAKPAPKGLIIGIVIGVLVIAGGVVMKIKSDHAASEKKARIEAQKREDDLLRKQQEQEAAFQAQVAKLTKQLTEAKTEAERESLKRQIEEASSHRAAASAARKPASAKEASPKPAAGPLIKDKRKISDDPLEGL